MLTVEIMTSVFHDNATKIFEAADKILIYGSNIACKSFVGEMLWIKITLETVEE